MAGRPAEARFHETVAPGPAGPAGDFVELDGEPCYRIAAFDRLAPFLMTVASDTDLWLFVTSGGGLTAGRVDAEGSLFPYRTSDQLHDAHHHTGPVTLIRIEEPGSEPVLWEPFRDRDGDRDGARIERNLYKNVLGNRLIFEEIRHDLGLAFRYRWAGCDRFGWVRTAALANRGAAPVQLAVLDGLRNVLPWGAPLALYQQASNLVNAYRCSEVDPDTGLGIFSLTAGITDRAEALEVLRANTVWCTGPETFRVHLADQALEDFRAGRLLSGQRRRNGGRGSYLVSWAQELAGGAESRWHLAGDVGRDHGQIAELRRGLRAGGRTLQARVDGALDGASENLRRIVASADGLQLTGRDLAWSHHLANVLFNCMRGGVFADNDRLPVADFVAFLETRNRRVRARHRAWLDTWPETTTSAELRTAAARNGDPQLQRLALEYLPLTFGRRHGDPSRPWNRFEIRVRDRQGQPVLHYEGNWRDIFQNWEALAVSFPAYLVHFVAKFVNASTVDGFNPYRLTSEGVDWETAAADDPWSNIGYWGDHQLIYLLKLLEALDRHDAGALPRLLAERLFSYAEVPYVIKPYAAILADPGRTIDYDLERAERIAARCAELGSDGKLLHDPAGEVVHVNLLEKLLVPALAKLSNLIPGAGIWMNTQRPEWNDANNALAGGGVSVVTLCYLRRYLAFLADLLERLPQAARLPVSAEVVEWFEAVAGTLAGDEALVAAAVDDPAARRRVMDELGEAFAAYRATVYRHGLSNPRELDLSAVIALCRAALARVDDSIRANRREDGLYHAYNLLELGADTARIGRLPEMLEGQVAALSSGAIAPAESLDIVEQLFASRLYRPDQRSFLLYPARELPGFLERNVVPADAAAAIPLLEELLGAGDTSLIARDHDGVLRFQGDLRNADDLAAVLDGLAGQPSWSEAVARDRAAVLELFETVFRHRSYTGRSGVMYGYEGLGCVYWHMVAKLLLAVQENGQRAEREGAPAELRDRLARCYFRVRAGIGYERSVGDYGAFPTDPYSHTPPDGGARQPGMTGQVKEEILTRFGELGVEIAGGRVRFAPTLLQPEEYLPAERSFAYLDLAGRPRALTVPAGGLAFTLCQVPVVYRRGEGEASIRVVRGDGAAREIPGQTLDQDTSRRLFLRRQDIDRIEVTLPPPAQA
jgi:hypothetical protein